MVTRKVLSKQIFKVLQVKPEWNPVPDETLFVIFGGFTHLFCNQVLWLLDRLSSTRKVVVQADKNAFSRKTQSRYAMSENRQAGNQ